MELLCRDRRWNYVALVRAHTFHSIARPGLPKTVEDWVEMLLDSTCQRVRVTNLKKDQKLWE